MQFAASNQLKTHRRPNMVEHSQIESAPAISFDTALHGPQRVPDQHVHCFSNFRSWLHAKPAFSKPTDVSEAHLNPAGVDHAPADTLDALALSSLANMGTSYDIVKKMWHEQCLHEPEPDPPATETYPGSTDSAMDVFKLLAS
jgi:hypothetical protein